MNRHKNTRWLMAIPFLLCTLMGAAQDDCNDPQCLLYEAMDNEVPGLTDSGMIMGDFPISGPCLSAVNASIYSFQSLSDGDVTVILTAATGIGSAEELQAGLFTATDACDATSYQTIDCGTTQDQLLLESFAVDSGSTFYVIVNGGTTGSDPADIGFTIQIAGTAVELDSPFSVLPIFDINIGQAVQLDASQGASSYDWQVIDGDFGSIALGEENEANPTVMPTDTTEYQLTAVIGGCTQTYSVTANVIISIFARNVVTPNDDGKNDVWFIGNAFLYPLMDVRIFSRWGQEVFRSTGYDPDENGWDGTNNGSPLPAGSYYYVIDLAGDGNEETTVTGSVAILY